MGKLVSASCMSWLVREGKLCKQVGCWTSWADSEHYENGTKLL